MQLRRDVEINYWRDRVIDWHGRYFTPEHPHRDQIINVLWGIRFNECLEVGCGAGANLYRIKKAFGVKVAGVDVNKGAVAEAQANFPEAEIKLGIAEKIPFLDKSFDLILTDAAIMYIPPDRIEMVISELKRVARKYLVLCEWQGENGFDGRWVYNYEDIFKDYDVNSTKITGWQGGWEKYGKIITVKL